MLIVQFSDKTIKCHLSAKTVLSTVNTILMALQYCPTGSQKVLAKVWG